ncbi:hypothetical protein ACO1O0_002581 [Amphichorda felina]
MKAFVLTLVAIQALLVAGSPTEKDAVQSLKARVSDDVLNLDLDALDALDKRGCDYGDCDGCLGGWGGCIICNGGGADGPGPCATCWVYCAANCGC